MEGFILQRWVKNENFDQKLLFELRVKKIITILYTKFFLIWTNTNYKLEISLKPEK